MIEEVKQGQKITSDLQNQIIRMANGQMIPSEGQFMTTESGPLFSSGGARTSSRQTLVPDRLFTCMYATSYNITGRSSSGTEYGQNRTRSWFLALAKSKDVLDALNCNSTLSIEDFAVLGPSQQLDGRFDEAWLNRSGWLDTGYQEISCTPGIAFVREGKDEDEDVNENPVYAVVYGSDDLEQEKSRIEEVFDMENDVEVLKAGKIAVYSEDTNSTRQMVLPKLVDAGGEISCDSEISSLGLSSVQHIEDEETGEKALELFNFHDISAVETVPLSDIIPGEQDSGKSLLMREYDEDSGTAVLKYVQLSGLGISCDSEDEEEKLSSVAKTDSGNLTLFRFGEGSTDVQFDLSSMVEKKNEYQLLVRHVTEDGTVLEYAALSSADGITSSQVSSMVEMTLDRILSAKTDSGKVDVVQDQTFSIQSEVISGDVKLELYDFHNVQPTRSVALDSLLDDGLQPQNTNHLLVRHYDGDNNKLEYVSLTSISPKVDTGNYGDQKSVDKISADNREYLELYHFDQTSSDVKVALSSLVGNGDRKILVKNTTGNGNVLEYMEISSLGLSADVGTSIDVDAQYMASKFPHRYSIDWMPDADNNDKVLQMYRFDESPTNSQYKLRFDDDGQIPQNTISADFIVREYSVDAGGVNMEVNYQDGKEVVVPHEVTDGERYAQTGNGHVSINYAQGQQGEPKALQLYNFSSYSTTSDANGLSANGDGILIRKKSSSDNHLELQYLNITGLRKLVSMPILSALNGLSVVTGIEYPMTGTNQYKIVAHRKQINVVDNVLTITNLADQTIDTVAHDSIYPNN